MLMRKIAVITIIIAVGIFVICIYLLAMPKPFDNTQDTGAIAGQQRANAINATLYYDHLKYGKMIDANTFRDSDSVNYSFGRIVYADADYYSYNASKQLEIVPVKNMCATSNQTTYFTVDPDKQDTVSIFTDDGDESGLTFKEKLAAIKLALNDPYAKDAISEIKGYSIVSVRSLSVFDAGYINYTGNMAIVYLSVGRPQSVPVVAFNIIVDIQNGREMDMFQYFPSPIDRSPIVPETAVIPAGAYRYHVVPIYWPNTHYSYNGTLYFEFTTGARFKLSNATVYTALVDRANLEKLNDGSAWGPFIFVDQSTNKTSRYNFSRPITSGWTAHVKSQLKVGVGTDNIGTIYSVDSPYYLLLKNNDTRDITLEYVDGPIGSNPDMEYSIPDLSYDHVVRNYTHNVSGNVTINIFEQLTDRININQTGSDKINIRETAFYDPLSSPRAISDYVKFAGNDDNLTVYISLARVSDENFTDKKSYAKVEVDIPRNTHYTINYTKDLTGYP